jgi:alpha-tubulin suppressor-like RCC1 family protein
LRRSPLPLLAALTLLAGGCDSTTRRGDSPVRFSSVSVGSSTACALDTRGNAYCWGHVYSEPYDSALALRPTRVAAGHRFQALATGPGGTACGIEPGGALYCWGFQAGSSTPVRLAPGLTLSTLTLGGDYSPPCFLDGSGAAYCAPLGRNPFYDYQEDFLPVPVGGNFGEPVVGISASGYRLGFGGSRSPISFVQHACLVTGTGVGYCWGDNGDGQLGDGSTARSDTLVPVAGGVSFRSIATSSVSTCGLSREGEIYCWGATPLGLDSVPVRTATDARFSSLAVGADHRCAVAVDGDAYCWGYDLWGMLGNGEMNSDPSTVSAAWEPTPQRVLGGLSFRSISVAPADYPDSSGSVSCGVTTDGSIYCWGDNAYGRLGDGSTTSSAVPVRVADPA